MTRLRLEEGERAYARLINVPRPHQPSPDVGLSTTTRAFAEVNRPSTVQDVGDEEVTMNEVHRQVTLIVNFLVSIAGVAATLWIAAQWWPTPARLFLTLGGSLLVAIAEVAVYSGYMWRLEKSKQKQGAVKEVKQVVKTWVVGQDSVDNDANDNDSVSQKSQTTTPVDEKIEEDGGTVRRRLVAASTARKELLSTTNTT